MHRHSSRRNISTNIFRGIQSSIKNMTTATTTTTVQQTRAGGRRQININQNQQLRFPPQRRYVTSPLSLIKDIPKMTARTVSSSSSSPSTSTTATALKTWPAPMIESRGDYREEAHLEHLLGDDEHTPLYSAQSSLPLLPIPEINETISSFLPTALPLAESEREAQDLVEACRVFPSQAAELHRRLVQRRDVEVGGSSSWLSLWWNTAGYLQVRDPVVVNVSYFFHFSDDGTLPQPPPPPLQSKSTSTKDWSLGVHRAASILYSCAEFRKQICTGSFPHIRLGRKEPKTPLCSVAYKYMFNACRVPKREQDSYRIYDPSRNTHCVVACKGNFYAVDFVDDCGDPLPLPVIEQRLNRCVELANNNCGDGGGELPLNIGWFTSSDRDSWADAREELLRVGGDAMQRALEKLESGALMICLDDEEPVSRRQCADIFWTGGLSSGHNRWFDKSIQIMCSRNGKAGLIGEHSMMDGMPMIDLADYVTKQTYKDVQLKSSSAAAASSSAGGVENIFQDCVEDISSEDSRVDSLLAKAKEDFTCLITDHSLDVQGFQGYGSDYIKKVGYSPDAYVQMAIQLAIYRLFGKQAGTYEATQMRPYLHGRTETTRTVSPASAAFVKSMGLRPQNDINDESKRNEKLSLLRDAVQSHVEYIKKAGKGKGVDRHFFGMSMLLTDKDTPPTLFSDPLFIRSKRWRVSTSHLTHPRFENWGFGEVVPDGVGVGYAVKKDSCIFNLTARKEHAWTERLSHLLEEALLEMQLLNDLGKKQKSKL